MVHIAVDHGVANNCWAPFCIAEPIRCVDGVHIVKVREDLCCRIQRGVHALARPATTNRVFGCHVALVELTSHQVLIEAPWVIAQSLEWDIRSLEAFPAS